VLVEGAFDTFKNGAMRMNNAAQLLAPDNLPLDLGEIGIVKKADQIMPGVYRSLLAFPESYMLGDELYIVLRDAPDISETAKSYATAAPGYSDLLVFTSKNGIETHLIIDYEVALYQILHGESAHENLQEIAAFGAELYPEYFGDYPAPVVTPWGYTTRYKTIFNGVFWVETELGRRGLAIAFPRFEDLEGMMDLAEPFEHETAYTKERGAGYIFYREKDSCVPLHMLISHDIWNKALHCDINYAALVNAIHCHHPEYPDLREVADESAGTEFIVF